MSFNQNHPHILIIEDDPGIATSLRSGLEREGFRVTWKDQGEDGVSFVQETRAGFNYPGCAPARWFGV